MATTGSQHIMVGSLACAPGEIQRLRQEVVRMQIQVAQYTDSIGHLRFKLECARVIVNYLMPLAGEWARPPHPDVLRLVMPFVLGPIASTTWVMYPMIAARDEDPALPYHEGHWLANRFSQGIPTTSGGDNVEEVFRLRYTHQMLRRQLLTIALDHDILEPHCIFWSRRKERLSWELGLNL